jgi:prevent-host-death family protein
MLAFDLGEAEARIEELVALAETGEDVVITKDGQPVARLVSVASSVGSGDGDQ